MIELEDLVPVLGEVEGGAEGEVAGADEVGVELELDTLVLDVTRVDPLALHAGGVREVDAHHLVHGVGVIVGEVEAQAVLEEVPLGTDFPGSHHLGLQVGVRAGGRVGDVVEVVDAAGGAQQGHQLIGIGILTHLGPGSAELAVVEDVLVVAHAHLVEHAGEEVGNAHGRIEVAAVRGREGGGPVVTGGHVQEEEVLPTHVREGVQGLDLLLVDVVVGVAVQLAGPDVIGTGERNVLGDGAEGFALVVHDVAAHAGAELEVAELVVVGEEAFQVVLEGGGLLLGVLRPVEAGGVVQTRGLIRHAGPGDTFLHLEGEVLHQVDGEGTHAEELVLGVAVHQVVLDEEGVLAVRAHLVPVDLGFRTGTGRGGVGIEPVLGEVGDPDVAGHREDAEGGTVRTAGLAVVTGRVHVVGLHVQLEPVGELVAGDEVHAGALDVGVLHHGVGVVVTEGETERVVLSAAGEGHVVALAVPGAVEFLPGILRADEGDLGGAVPPVVHGGGGAHFRTPGTGGLLVIVAQGTLAVLVLEGREIGDGRPGELAAVADTDLLLALAALLGGDEDDTVTGAGAVQGRRGGALQHGNALDVLGVDVEGAALVVHRTPKTGLVGTGRTAVVVGDAVHHVQRGVVVGEGGVATEDHPGGTAGAGRRIVDHQAGHLARKGIGEGDSAAAGELFRLDVLHGVAEGLLFTGNAEGGDDDFVQEFAVFLEDDLRRSSVKDVFDGRIADAGHLDGGADRHVVDREGTVGIRDGAVGGSRYHDARADDGADVVRDDTGGRAVLGGCGPGNAYEDRSQQD